MALTRLLLLGTAFLLLLFSRAEAAGEVGVNYGRVANNLPNPASVVQLLKDNGITMVKIYDTNDAVLRSFANTGIKLMVMMPNENLARAGSDPAYAAQWVQDNVKAYYPATKIHAVAVGNEVFADGKVDKMDLVPAMTNVQAGLASLGLADDIKVSSPIKFDALQTSWPPSAGRFRDDIAQPVMKPMLELLQRTGSYLTINAYPFFTYYSDRSISLDYALGNSNPGVHDDKANLRYDSLLDAQLDATHYAMEDLGVSNVEAVTGETGWPPKGTVGGTLPPAVARRLDAEEGDLTVPVHHGAATGWPSRGHLRPQPPPPPPPRTETTRGHVPYAPATGWPSHGHLRPGPPPPTAATGGHGGGRRLLDTDNGDAGSPASISNARAYNNNLINRMLSGRTGTPHRPNANMDVYIFALFNENDKGSGGNDVEQNFGLFYPNETKVYEFSFQGGGGAPGPPTDSWCVGNAAAGDKALQDALDYACGHGADCSAIQPAGSCYEPNTVLAHASYAFNSYYQKKNRATGTCNFNGAASIVYQAPADTACSSAKPSWCVAKAGAGDAQLQTALDYACGHGADCSAIQAGGSCFQPDNKAAHASYAFNDYYQRKDRADGTCDFSGAAAVVYQDPGLCAATASWCVAKPGVGDDQLKKALDYACGNGADCRAIQSGGPCFQPDNMASHASYAFNSYYQHNSRATVACDFSGAATVVYQQPKVGNCVLPSKG